MRTLSPNRRSYRAQLPRIKSAGMFGCARAVWGEQSGRDPRIHFATEGYG